MGDDKSKKIKDTFAKVAAVLYYLMISFIILWGNELVNTLLVNSLALEINRDTKSDNWRKNSEAHKANIHIKWLSLFLLLVTAVTITLAIGILTFWRGNKVVPFINCILHFILFLFCLISGATLKFRIYDNKYKNAWGSYWNSGTTYIALCVFNGVGALCLLVAAGLDCKRGEGKEDVSAAFEPENKK